MAARVSLDESCFRCRTHLAESWNYMLLCGLAKEGTVHPKSVLLPFSIYIVVV